MSKANIFMKAMILAAGEGRRMLPLTKDCPKPLLKVGEYSLLEHQLFRLKKVGIKHVLINVAYLAQNIIDTLGDGSQYDMHIEYSIEPQPLETGGAINLALPWFCQELLSKTKHSSVTISNDPFVLINGDVWSDFDLQILLDRSLEPNENACLVLVPNPDHNLKGDFSFLNEENTLLDHRQTHKNTFTFSGISLQRPSVIYSYPRRREIFPLKEVFDDAIKHESLVGLVHNGLWVDVGTPERLLRIQDDYSKV